MHLWLSGPISLIIDVQGYVTENMIRTTELVGGAGAVRFRRTNATVG